MNEVIVEDPIILDMIKDRRDGLSILERLVKREVRINQKSLERVRYSFDLFARRMDLWDNKRLYRHHENTLSSLMKGLSIEDKGLLILLLTKSFELSAIENRFEEKILKCKLYKKILGDLYKRYAKGRIEQRWILEWDNGYES